MLAAAQSTASVGLRAPASLLPARLSHRSSRGMAVTQAVARPSATPSTSTSPAAPSPSALLSNWYMAGAIATPWLLNVQEAAAVGGANGILEGRTAALVHPAMNFILLASSLYAAYLGWQWRRTRTIGEEIRALKAASPAAAAMADGTPAPPNPAVEEKEKERKELLAGGFKDKHTAMGSVLLAVGVGIAIEGCANTYMRTGKLFPGPHLYAGASIVALWAFAAALVPQMQKGNDLARNAHIAANTLNVGLFLWQVPTGLQIVEKVFQFTQWP